MSRLNMSLPTALLAYRPANPRQLCRGVVFALPDLSAMYPAGMKSNDWLTELGCPEKPRESAEADDILAAMLDDRAKKLPLPAAAAVTDRADPQDERCGELVNILAVLAKSSGRVYLRDKEPNLTNLRWGRRAVVLVPR